MKVDLHENLNSSVRYAIPEKSQRALVHLSSAHDNGSQDTSKQPSFKGRADDVRKIIEATYPKALKVINKMESLKGEKGGIVITAVGTGCVAPIFIGFNPFVKAPKNATEKEKQEVRDTKLYTAMRQPISAFLAILFQVSVLKYIDKALDKLFNNPDASKYVWSHFDQSTLNNDSFLKSEIMKNEFKGRKKPSLLKGFSKGFKKVLAERENYENELKSLVKAKSNEQVTKLAESFERTGRILINPQRKVGKRHLDNETVAKLLNKQIDSYIKDADELRITDDKLAFYKKRATTLINNENHLKEILFDKLPVSDDVLKDLINKETNPDVKVILEEILAKPEDIRLRRIKRTEERICKIKEMCGSKEFTPDDYVKKLCDRNSRLSNRIAELKIAKIEHPEKATIETIRETINSVVKWCSFDKKDKIASSILSATDTFQTDKVALKSKTYKDITKAYKDMIKDKYKAPNQISKILVGVFITLPITCNVLNWVYPRFMELVFPKLSGAKKSSNAKVEGGKK